ncbi:hypothetical protein DASC09_002800 [Saccharomycopsis crataegensis]|uniref:Elongation of fatty acids protein n=1 Tax=Saccharomycopsis crataegensis TaxID=43959 RepID=A0AAV5QER7_9ASCO|nr:hypothetical protein DASC09_002800 [Saccharomycopsis crataegensis]
MDLSHFARFATPAADVLKLVPDLTQPLPPPPFTSTNETLKWLYEGSFRAEVPLTIAFIYFTSVHFFNSLIRKKQMKQADAKGIKYDINDAHSLKSLPPVPVKIATTKVFKLLVILHNLGLCVFSIWTCYGAVSLIKHSSHDYAQLFSSSIDTANDFTTYKHFVWNAICDVDDGIFNPTLERGLSFYAYWFYLSKFYEVFDTVIILLKGRPSLLLQSYHHSGAMLSMWAGSRYRAPPIWIFVVFNSFVHSIMYFYYTLSTLHIRVPRILKQSLTTMQIIQFIVGGSLATVHLFIQYYQYSTKTFQPCIKDGNHFFALYVNVGFLFPLTILFMAFWVDNYARRLASSKTKTK